ncbi:MAG: hypothetical protein Q8R02_22280 [Hyphomonadaceae bacterium]|nr:hypothetical protein [Hyphomonadaceae bacterium]
MDELHRNLASKEGLRQARRSSLTLGKPQSLIRLLNTAFVAAGTIYLAIFVYSAVGASILEPYSDMIDLIDDYFRAVDMGRAVEHLLDPHNFHRIPWLRSLIAADVSLFRGTGLPLVVAAVMCLAGTALLLMIEVRRVAGGLAFPLLALAGMLVFLTANAAGVSVPANTPHVLATFFSLVALAAAASASGQSGGWRRWAAAIVCAAAASLSLATALVVWPILVLMAWHGKASWRATSFVAIAGGAFCLAYLAGQSVDASLQQGFEPEGLIKAAKYFLAYLGLPWVRGSRLLGELLGAGLLAASVFALIRFGPTEANRTQRLALGMILFSLGGAALAAVGRRDIAFEVDVPVRYAILLAPLHTGLLLLAAPAIVRAWESRPRFVAHGLIAALAIVMVQQVMVGTVVVRAAERARQTIALYHQGGRTPEMLQWIYPDLAYADNAYAEMLRRGVFLRWVGGSRGFTSPETAGNRASSSEGQIPSETIVPAVSLGRDKHIEDVP